MNREAGRLQQGRIEPVRKHEQVECVAYRDRHGERHRYFLAVHMHRHGYEDRDGDWQHNHLGLPVSL